MSAQLARLLHIDREIRKGAYPSAEELAGLFEVKTRTIYEDIRKLRNQASGRSSHAASFSTRAAGTLPPFAASEERSGCSLSTGSNR